MPNSGIAFIEIKGPKGETVTTGAAGIMDSTIGFSWTIPTTQAGGEYTVRVSHPLTGDAPAERKFDIRSYRPPRLKSQIVFLRDGYGPGDAVVANLHVERAEGGIPAGARVSVSGRVDGDEVWRGEATVDAAGNASARFNLPSVIARGEGTIAMVIQDGGAVETAAKTIPILLHTLDVKIYPEGGDLIAGLPNRVYIEGKTPNKKPADMAGIVVDDSGREVGAFRTEHEGRGRFVFTPARGVAYSLRVTEPAGIVTPFALPAVKDSGVVISSTADVTSRQKNVVVRVGATVAGEYGVALSQHGKEIAFTSETLAANKTIDVAFSVPRSLDGVIVATVYDDQKMPVAERLLFREPERRLRVHVTADQSDFTPGDKVSLRVATTDDKGKPVGAVVGLTVTDSSVLELIEKREQAPRLPVMVLLENDVQELADAHVYLDENNPKAPLATDLLLGTQGWRRFATVHPTGFLADNGDSARRALAIRMLSDVDRARAASLGPQSQLAAANVVVNGMGVGRGAGVGGVVGGVLGGVPGPPIPAAVPPPAPLPRDGQQGQIALKDEEAKEVQQQQLGQALAFAMPVVAQAEAPAFGAGGAGGGGRGARAALAKVAVIPTLTVREYAHTLRPGWTEGARNDFTETVYWNAAIKTDAATGVATVSFNLSDSVTAFRAIADGFTSDGALGSSVTEIESVRPFSIEPKMPLQVTSGDIIQLPIAIVNGRNHQLADTEIAPSATITGFRVTPLAENGGNLAAKERARRLMSINVDREFSGVADLTLDAKAGAYRDTVTRKLDVQPLGFPFESATGGMLEPNRSSSFDFALPKEIVHASVSSKVVVYPTPLASMTDALQALLMQPNGCFEQTSSTSYPLVMAQQYFLAHTGVDPAIVEKAKGLLDVSYKRLTGFESRSRGYEWFGADPGHEALTAYGLMQFTDMSHVRDVDTDMLQRTRDWLLARRDGNGGFSRSSKAIDSFGRAPEDTTNVYITWALVESGQKGLDKEIAWVKAAANSSQDSYVIALAANILHASGDRAASARLMEKLARLQDPAGNVKGAVTSITRSGGAGLDIETTALSVLAWLREPAYTTNVEKGVRWVVESNKNGRFGSTQSTILALRAIVAYDSARSRPKAPGRIVLTVDGRAIGEPVAFTTNTQGAIVMPEFGKDLATGKHSVALKMEDGASMPFSIDVKYYSTLPDSSEQSRVAIQVKLKDREVKEGGVTEAVVSIANKSGEGIPTPVAIVGVPGGLEVRHDQLKELVKAGRIDAYEVNGREVVLYWRFLKPKDQLDIPLSLVAAVPGTYTGPASRAYLYYTDEYKSWAPGLNVNITPR
jgi:hypothetical protein